jgi:hypothetical protein
MTVSKPSRFLSAPIYSISGTVSQLQTEVLEYVNPEKPTHDHSDVYYKRFYIAQFMIDGKTIEAKFSSPMKIANGDHVTVSGYSKGDLFQVLAYTNPSQQVSGQENWIVLALGALLFLAVAIGLLNSQPVIDGAVIPKLFLVGFVLVALYMGYRALLIREALRLLQS